MKSFFSLQHDPGLLCYQDNSVIVPRQQADSAALSKHIGISPNSKLQIRNFKPKDFARDATDPGIALSAET